MEAQEKPGAREVFSRLFRSKSKDRKASDVLQPSGGSFRSPRTSLNVDSRGQASTLSSATSINSLGPKEHHGSSDIPLANTSDAKDFLVSTENSAGQWSKIHEVHSDADTHRGSRKEAAVVAPSDEFISDDQPYDLWNAAYDHLKETKYELVIAYEKILTNQPNIDGDAEIMEDSTNAFEGITRQQRAERMREIVDKALEKAKRHIKFKGNIARAAEFIKKAEDIVGSTLQSYPPAALAWSGICVLLPAMVRPITQNKAMYDGLDHVIERMEWYIALSRLLLRKSWENDKDFSSLGDLLAQRVQDLYEALIEYEMKSVCRKFHTHPVVNAIRDVMALNDWDSKLNSVIELEKKVNRDIKNYNTQNIVEELHQISTSSQHLGTIVKLTRDILEQAQQRQRAEEEQDRRITELERSKLVSAFSASPYNSRIKANPARVEGTCEWFRKHPKFRQWLDSKDNGLLLVSADPGCGKSVLARFLIEDELPKERRDATICYFFFKDNIEQRNIANALCALLHRIFSCRRQLLENLKTTIVEAGEMVKENWQTLWDIFVKACEDPAAGEVICVLDALDECESSGRGNLIELLKSYINTNSKAKFLVTTRRYPGIVDEFEESHANYLRLAGEGKDEVDQIQNEIDLVVDFRVKELSRKRKLGDREQLIKKKLDEKGSEQTTYLWVRLIFEVLEQNFEDSKSAWTKLIDCLPLTVAGTYEELLKRVPPQNKEIDRDMLHIMIAAFRPLSLGEMNIALRIRGCHDVRSLDDIDLIGNFRSWIINTCGFFVTEYDGTLFLIHQTAKEFLLELPTHNEDSTGAGGEIAPNGGWTWKNTVTETMAHRVLAESCISFLTIRCFNIGPLDLDTVLFNFFAHHRVELKIYSELRESIKNIPHFNLDFEKFLIYASRNWPLHFEKAQVFGKDGDLIQDVRESYWPSYVALFDNQLGYKAVWLLDYALHTHTFSRSKVNFICSAKVFAAKLGHLRLLRDSATTDSDVESKHGHCEGYELITASQGSSTLSVEYLLKHGADINVQDPASKRTVLHYAVLRGNSIMVNAILERKPQLEVVDVCNRTPLHVACGAHIETYLPWPGNLDLVPLLLKHGAKANARDEHQLTPLHYACWRMGIKVVKALVTSGAEIDAKDDQQRTPLYFACFAVIHAVIEFLVESGANINARNDRSQTPLHRALEARGLSDEQRQRKRKMVQYMVDNGADVNAKDDSSRTILDEAKAHGDREIVDFLLQNGARDDS